MSLKFDRTVRGFATISLAMLLTAANAEIHAQVVDSAWSQPLALSGTDTGVSRGYVVSDSRGNSHTFWSEADSQTNQIRIFYARFDGDTWSRPLQVYLAQPGVHIGRMSFTIDSKDILHASWTELETDFVLGSWPRVAPLTYFSLPSSAAALTDSWRSPIKIDIPAFWYDLQTDGSGTVHLVYSNPFSKPVGIFYVRSLDSGRNWSQPVLLDPDATENAYPYELQLRMDGANKLHVAWEYKVGSDTNAIRYAHSLDGGTTWSGATTLDQVGSDPQEISYGYPLLSVRNGTVNVMWTGGGWANVGRRHRFSTDSGNTWSGIQQLFGGLHGQVDTEAFRRDPSGRLHYLDQIRFPQGLWHATWSSSLWSDPALVYLIADDWNDPRGDRIHLNRVNLATPGNQLVTTFTTEPDMPHRLLYSMHTKKPMLYLPHFAEGGEYSMSFAVSNLADAAIHGTLRIYGADGRPQEVSLESGKTTEAMVDLAPRATRVISTTGSAPAVTTGYIKLELDREAPVSLTSVFRFKTGGEASVLPTVPGRKFALFVERAADFDTGIAACRFSSKPITLKLYDPAGSLVQTRTWDFDGYQQARFVRELFDVSETFRGLLIMESEGDFAPLGLRFGDKVRSTIPVTNLDAVVDQKVFYFPQYADGDGWSMLVASSNLASQAATGKETFYDSNGQPQTVPTDGGAASEIALNLGPLSSKVLLTTGASSPLKRGFVKVELDQAQATGVAVFRFGSGLEASVLPTPAAKRFAIFTERTAALETGVAVVRLSTEPVNFRIYDTQGNQIQSGVFAMDGSHEAKFVSQLATLPDSFTGLLVLESSGDFAPLGLRFGKDVLSTIPVVPF